jgi:hypothetical protein
MAAESRTATGFTATGFSFARGSAPPALDFDRPDLPMHEPSVSAEELKSPTELGGDYVVVEGPETPGGSGSDVPASGAVTPRAGEGVQAALRRQSRRLSVESAVDKRERAELVFEELDEDGDGVVPKELLDELLRRLQFGHVSGGTSIFLRACVDKVRGGITKEKFCSWYVASSESERDDDFGFGAFVPASQGSKRG